MSWLALTVLLVLSSCSCWMLAGGQTCSTNGDYYLARFLYAFRSHASILDLLKLQSLLLVLKMHAIVQKRWRFEFCHLAIIMHAAAMLAERTVTVSAEREDGPTPGARVTWSKTVPPECVASVTVEFRTSSSGSVVRSYTTSASETEVIQTDLQCDTTYYIRVVVTGVAPRGNLTSEQVQVLVGGKVKHSLYIVQLHCV